MASQLDGYGSRTWTSVRLIRPANLVNTMASLFEIYSDPERA
jgi:hypothetical protein